MSKIDVTTDARFQKAYRSALTSLYDAAEALAGIDGMTPAHVAAMTATRPHNAMADSDYAGYRGADAAYNDVQSAASRLAAEGKFLDHLVEEIDELLLDARCGE